MQNNLVQYLSGFEEYLSDFEKLLVLYAEWNSKINISSIRDEQWIIIKHFYDSLLWNEFLQWQWIKVLDIWTWWWFPLLPLAIVNPWIKFVWLDSVWKKLKVIEAITADLWLKNVSLINWRAEELSHSNELRGRFDIITERAFAPWSAMLELSIPFLKVWWLLIAYQTPLLEDVKKNKKIQHILWIKIEKVIDHKLPEDMWDRRLVLIRKLHETNPKYPRSFTLCKTEPL